MLDVQFRMHPDIAEFVGRVFYPEGLATGVSAEDRRLAFAEFTRPVVLISTSAYGDRFEEAVQPSYRNALEAKMVRRIVEKADRELDAPRKFGVITPYASQVQLILKELDGRIDGLTNVKLGREDVASVHSFQGSERDVIIISFARSPRPCTVCQGSGERRNKAGHRPCESCNGRGSTGPGLRFVRDLRLLNVGFSRAARMLILIGDFDALTDPRKREGAAGGQVLADFRDYVTDRGQVLHVWEQGVPDGGD